MWTAVQEGALKHSPKSPQKLSLVWTGFGFLRCVELSRFPGLSRCSALQGVARPAACVSVRADRGTEPLDYIKYSLFQRGVQAGNFVLGRRHGNGRNQV